MATYCRHPYSTAYSMLSVSLLSGGSILQSNGGPFLASGEASLLQFSVELLSFTIAVIQLPFPALPSFLIHKNNLLKARVIIHTYHDHVGSFLPSLWS
jgi:hypothetical protein